MWNALEKITERHIISLWIRACFSFSSFTFKTIHWTHRVSFHLYISFVQVVSVSSVRTIRRVHPGWGTKCVAPRSWCRLWPRGQTRTPGWGLSVDGTVRWTRLPSSTTAPCLHLHPIEDERTVSTCMNNASFTCSRRNRDRREYSHTWNTQAKVLQIQNVIQLFQIHYFFFKLPVGFGFFFGWFWV